MKKLLTLFVILLWTFGLYGQDTLFFFDLQDVQYNQIGVPQISNPTIGCLLAQAETEAELNSNVQDMPTNFPINEPTSFMCLPSPGCTPDALDPDYDLVITINPLGQQPSLLEVINLEVLHPENFLGTSIPNQLDEVQLWAYNQNGELVTTEIMSVAPLDPIAVDNYTFTLSTPLVLHPGQPAELRIRQCGGTQNEGWMNLFSNVLGYITITGTGQCSYDPCEDAEITGIDTTDADLDQLVDIMEEPFDWVIFPDEDCWNGFFTDTIQVNCDQVKVNIFLTGLNDDGYQVILDVFSLVVNLTESLPDCGEVDSCYTIDELFVINPAGDTAWHQQTICLGPNDTLPAPSQWIDNSLYPMEIIDTMTMGNGLLKVRVKWWSPRPPDGCGDLFFVYFVEECQPCIPITTDDLFVEYDGVLYSQDDTIWVSAPPVGLSADNVIAPPYATMTAVSNNEAYNDSTWLFRGHVCYGDRIETPDCYGDAFIRVWFRYPPQSNFDSSGPEFRSVQNGAPETVVNLKLYPNPASNYIVIETGTETPTLVRIWGPLGQSVWSGTVTGKKELSLGALRLPAGTYFVQIAGGKTLQLVISPARA